MAHQALAQGEFERVVFIPAASPPHRSEDLDMAPFSARLAMAELACASEPRFVVSDIEAHLPAPSYTCDTLRHLYPTWSAQNPIAMVIGTDALAGLATWKDPAWLAAHVEFWQAPRTGTPLVSHVRVNQTDIPLQTVTLNMPAVDISATQIRQALSTQQSVCAEIQTVLPASVQAYCVEHDLYGSA